MIYLASPYSHPDPVIMRTRFLLAEQCTGILLRNRVYVYSPIVHCHEIAQKEKLPTDFAFWQGYNFDFLRRSDSLYILDIEGWQDSKGVMAEYKLAEAAHIPAAFITPDGDIALVPHT